MGLYPTNNPVFNQFGVLVGATCGLHKNRMIQKFQSMLSSEGKAAATKHEKLKLLRKGAIVVLGAWAEREIDTGSFRHS